VVIDFSRYSVGAKVTLKNRIGEGRAADVMQFRVVRAEKDENRVPERLSDMTEFDAFDCHNLEHEDMMMVNFELA
jgi:spore coat protein A